MSTRTGTLQPPRGGRAFWVPALLTLMVASAFTVTAIVVGTDEGRDDARIGAVESTRFANAPDEQLSGGRRVVATTSTLQGTLANTPTELRAGIAVASVGGTLANTPTELTGGMSFGQPHEVIIVNDRVCGQCR